MRVRGILTVLFSVLLLIFIVTGCAPALPYTLPENRGETVTEEELAALREIFPVSNKLAPMVNTDFSRSQTWEGYFAIRDIPAIVVVEVSDELLTAISGAYELTGLFVPATVRQVLAGDSDLLGTEINMFFGSTMMELPKNVTEIYQVGSLFVCILEECPSSYPLEHQYIVRKYTSFYLTETGVVLPITDYIACMNDCEGMYIDTFARVATEVFSAYGKPDAELTPVEPEVQAQ